MFILDVGGEGRHRRAWNLNPSPVKTIGADKGRPIARRIAGRANAIPMPDRSIDRIIVERTPLLREALLEIARVIRPRGVIVLRHVPCPCVDPHRLARQLLPGQPRTIRSRIGETAVQETIFRLEPLPPERGGSAGDPAVRGSNCGQSGRPA